MPDVTIKELAIPGDLSQLEAEATKNLSPEALGYILAGAGGPRHHARQRRGVPALEGQAAHGPQAVEG